MSDSFDIAIVGMGRAGRLRLPALRASGLAGRVLRCSRRLSERDLSFDEALEDPSVRVAWICTENADHAGRVRAALAAEKDVVVEYPLARTLAEARELHALAAGAGRTLHEAHVELQTAHHGRLREEAARLGRPRGGRYESQAGWEGWIADRRESGHPLVTGISRLHRLLDLWGDARIADRACRDLSPGFELTLKLEFAQGGFTELLFRRGPGLPREERWEIRCERGILRDPQGLPRVDPFLENARSILEALRAGKEPAPGADRALRAMALAESVEEEGAACL